MSEILSSVNNAIAVPLASIGVPIFTPLSSVSRSIGLNTPTTRMVGWFLITGGVLHWFKPGFTHIGPTPRPFKTGVNMSNPAATYFPWWLVSFVVGWGAMNYA